MDATGLATAAANGTATLTATSQAVSASATVMVAQAASAVTVSPAADTLLAFGDTVRLAAEARDGNGHTMAGAEFSWTSSDTTVATVDATGLVTAAANGAATVTATWGAVAASARVTVAQAISTVRVLPRSLSLPVGDTARLSAMALDALGTEVTDAAFEWSSSAPSVATVEESGFVRAAAVGVATITAASGRLRDSTRVSVFSDDPSDHHAALTAGLPERPFVNTAVGGADGYGETVGTLRLGLNPDVFPVIVSRAGDTPSLLVAGSRLGEGRVVALSGTDFLSSGEPGLLGNASVDRLLANAVRWAGHGAHAWPPRVVADNQGIADALVAQGFNGVKVVDAQGRYGPRYWNASALAGADVAVVVVNHRWGERLVPRDVAALRGFTERGGGLVIAGSAMHWSWWIEERHGPFTGEALLKGTGISWNEDSVKEIASATTSFDSRLLPSVVWADYFGGRSLDATQMAILPDLFKTAVEFGRTEELDLALARLVRETPALPTSSTVPEAKLAAVIAEELGPHDWPETHPWAAEFPGLPAADAIVTDGTVTVDATWSEFPSDARRAERRIPLGFYAPPSALVTIEVPAGHATGELRVEVGQDHDDLGRSYTRQSVWHRAPWIRRQFRLADRQTGVTNAYGGSIALVVPAGYAGTIPVTVRGAIPMAVYTAGESSAAEWFRALDAGAPQAIIQKSGGIRLVVSAESARGITDPGEVSTFWDGFRRRHAELAGEPVARAYESIWVFDPQVGWGYANAGHLRINYPLHAELWALLPGTAEGRRDIASLRNRESSAHDVDWWLFGHELGHQWQSGDWTAHETIEVTVNLFAMYTMNYHLFSGGDHNVFADGKTHHCAAPLDHAALAKRRWSTSNHCEKLALYRQLISEFGWDAMKAVFHSYYDPAYPRSTYGGELDGFAIRLSAIVQRDLVGFLRHWEYPLSESASATIRSFGYRSWLPPGW